MFVHGIILTIKSLIMWQNPEEALLSSTQQIWKIIRAKICMEATAHLYFSFFQAFKVSYPSGTWSLSWLPVLSGESN